MSSLHDAREVKSIPARLVINSYIKELNMNKRIVMIVVLLAVCIFVSTEAFSAWTQAKGSAYNQIALSHYHTTMKFTTLNKDREGTIIGPDHSVKRVDTEEFTSTKINYYSEYGITDKLTVIFSAPYDWQRSNDVQRYGDVDGPSGIGDIKVGLKHSLIGNVLGSGVLMSVQFDVKIPEAYDHGNPNTKLSLGDGQYDYEGALLFGRGLGKGYAWLDTRYVYRDYNKQHDRIYFKPSDKVKVALGGGYAVTSWMSLRASVNWSHFIGNARVSGDLIADSYKTGKKSTFPEIEIIKEDLSLESNSLSAGGDIALDVSKLIPVFKDTFPSKQIVLSYNRDLTGFGDLRSEDSSLGETYSVTFVFPGKGIFPVNLFARK